MILNSKITLICINLQLRMCLPADMRGRALGDGGHMATDRVARRSTTTAFCWRIARIVTFGEYAGDKGRGILLRIVKSWNFQEIHSSRLGLSTIASGKVRLRFRVIEQGQTTRSQGKDVHGNQMLIKAMRFV